MLISALSRRTTVALAAAASLSVLAVPAGAATSASATAAQGKASSALTILQVKLNGTSVAVGQLVATTSNAVSPHQAELVITPLRSSVSGAVGQQTVSAGQTLTVPSTPKSVALPGGLGSVTGPTLRAAAANTAAGPIATAALKALGSVQLVTVPLDLSAASLSDVSKVTSTAATARKTLSLGSLGLPSLQDLLASLGLDLDALLGQLTQGKLTQLAGLVTSTASGAVATANSAVDAAQAKVTTTVPATLDQAQTALTAAQAAATTAQTALNTATAAFSGALGAIPALTLAGAGLSTGTSADQFLSLNLTGAVLTALDTAAGANLTDLATAVKTAEATLATANAVVDQVQALVTALVQLVTAVLDAVTSSDDPLASLGNVKVVSSAVAAKTPTAKAAVSVGSVKVLGLTTDLNGLTSTLGGATKTLSSVLESVTGVSFTPPTIAIGTPAHSTRRSGTTRFASASITGVTLTLPSLTLPTALALPGVPTGVHGSVTIGRLAESSQWAPGQSAPSSTPSTPSTPQHPTSGNPLPDTGARMLLSVVGLVLIGTALAVRRRFARPA